MILIVEKVSAIFILALGLSYLLNSSWWVQYAKLLINQSFQLLSLLFLMLIFGSTVVVTHNIWVASPIVIVTLFGWAMLFKGFSMMLFPRLLRGFQNLDEKIVLTIIFVNGIVLTAAGGILFYLLFFMRS